MESSSELDRNIAQAIKTRRGLYPHELLILYEVQYYPIGMAPEEYPRTISDEIIYHLIKIRDYTATITGLLNRGFLKVGGIETKLQHVFAYKLKDICKEKHLKISGNKDMLITRLLENVPHDELEALFESNWYIYTESGRQELIENPYISYCAHQCMNYDRLNNPPTDAIWLMNKELAVNPNTSLEELWGKAVKNASLKDKKNKCIGKITLEQKTATEIERLQHDAVLSSRLSSLTFRTDNIYEQNATIDTLGQVLKQMNLAENIDNYFILENNKGDFLQSYPCKIDWYVVEWHEQHGDLETNFEQKEAHMTNGTDRINFETLITLIINFCNGDNYACSNIKWKPIIIG